MARKKYLMNEDGTGSATDAQDEEQLYRKKIGQRLQVLREHAGIGKLELARAMEVSPGCIYNWETGRTKPDIANLPRLCATLGITISEFFADEGAGSDLSEEERQLVMTYRKLITPNRETVRNITDELLRQQYRYRLTGGAQEEYHTYPPGRRFSCRRYGSG